MLSQRVSHALPTHHGAHPTVATIGAELARARAERDAAIAARDAAVELAAFLQERLRSTEAYLTEVVETALADERAERESLLAELALMNQELQERARADDIGAKVLFASVDDAVRPVPG